MVKEISSINYENWREELKDRLEELENVRLWLHLFLMGVDKQAREEGELSLDLPEAFVERVNAWDDMVNEMIGDMEKWAKI